MTTEAIELICEKLGTTLDNLVPAVIEYQMHKVSIEIWVGLTFTILGIILLAIAIILRNKDPIGLYIFSTMALIIGALVLGVGIFEKHMWTAYPQMSAYETLFSWLGNG